MNLANCSNPRYVLQPVYAKAESACKTGLRLKQKESFFKALMPQGFPTNYAQLVVSVFFLGSFIGENVINPVADVIGKRPAALAVVATFVVAAVGISQLNTQAMNTVVKVLQVMAIFAGIISLIYSINGGANVVPFHELVNSGTAAKNLLLILLFGVILGTHSTQIKQTFATIFDAKMTIAKPMPKLDKVNLGVVSSDEYLFSSLYE